MYYVLNHKQSSNLTAKIRITSVNLITLIDFEQLTYL